MNSTMTTNGVTPQLVMGGVAAVLAVLFGYGCLVSWPALALGYWGLLALFVYTQFKSYREDQSVAAFLDVDQKQHKKMLKKGKKQQIVIKKSGEERVEETVVAEVAEREGMEDVAEETPAQAEKLSKKAKKPKLQNKKVDAKVDAKLINKAPLADTLGFEEEFKTVPSTAQKKQKAAEKRAQKEEEQRKKDAEDQLKKAETQLRAAEAAATKATAQIHQVDRALQQADRAFQWDDLDNLPPKHEQTEPNRQVPAAPKQTEPKRQAPAAPKQTEPKGQAPAAQQTEPKGQAAAAPKQAEPKRQAPAAPSVVPPKVVAPKAKAVQQKPTTQESKAEKKKAPPPGVSIWDFRAKERAEAQEDKALQEAMLQSRTVAEMEELIIQEAMQQSRIASEQEFAPSGICGDFATYRMCPRGDACMWIHEDPIYDPNTTMQDMAADAKPEGNDQILYMRGMLNFEEQEDLIKWSSNHQSRIDSPTFSFDGDPSDIDTQKTPLHAGALPFLPLALREEFSAQFDTLQLGI